MNRTRAPGHIANRHVDKVESPYSPGTRGIAEDRNALQEELVTLIEYAGLTPSYADLTQVRTAIRKINKEDRMEVGQPFPLLRYKATVGWAAAAGDPSAYFPAVCVDNFTTPLVLTDSAYPDLAPYLRGMKATYAEGTPSAFSDIPITAWAIASNVASLTWASSPAADAIMAAIYEESIVHGSFAVPMTVPAIGTIVAGDYVPTSIDLVNRKAYFAYVAANGSGAVSTTVAFYPFKVPGSSSSARLFPMQGRTLVSANDSAGSCIPGLRRREMMKGHEHLIYADFTDRAQTAIYPNQATNGTGDRTYHRHVTASGARTIVADPINGPVNVGSSTHGADWVVHYFIHAGRVA